VVAPLEVRLVLVGDEHLGAGEVALGGDEWPAAVRAGIGGHDILSDVEAQAMPDSLDAPVAGVGPGPAAGLLTVAHLGDLFDAEGVSLEGSCRSSSSFELGEAGPPSPK